jgi:uncharacterized membrane-anchored protein
MRLSHKKIAVGALICVLAFVNWSIATKETHLAEGRQVYLELAPVDPRSLMQGDYMALRFSLADEVYDNLPKTKNHQNWRHDVAASDGFVVVSLDERQIATFVDIYEDQPLADGEILLRYRVRGGTVKFATNAYFFQEGDAKLFETALYGQFRVDPKGEVLLAALHDENLIELGANE